MNNLGIIGCGELGQQVLHIAKLQNKYKVVGFFDDFKEIGTFMDGIRVVGRLMDIDQFFINKKIDKLFLAIGYRNMKDRKRIFNSLSEKYSFAKIIHPNSVIDKTAEIGCGTIIYPGVIIDKTVKIGMNVLINNGCIVSHDTSIGAHSFLSPGVNIAGFVQIGECANLGISTTVIDNISIKSNTQTGAGTIIIKDIEIPGLYVGNPARFIR